MITALTAIYLVSAALCLTLFIRAAQRERYASTREIFFVIWLCVLPLINTCCLFWVAAGLIHNAFDKTGNERS